jgi:hypothetical protein
MAIGWHSVQYLLNKIMTHNDTSGIEFEQNRSKRKVQHCYVLDLLENLQRACYCNRHENLQLDLPSADSIFNIFTLVNLFFSLIR